jgi:hypothetical protein
MEASSYHREHDSNIITRVFFLLSLEGVPKRVYISKLLVVSARTNKRSSSSMTCSFWTLDTWIARLREHPEGPETLSPRCATVMVEVVTEVPLATPKMQAVQDS